MAKNYKLDLCSNRLCVKKHKIETLTFVAPSTDMVPLSRKGKTGPQTVLLRFCSPECKYDWLKFEYNKPEKQYNQWANQIIKKSESQINKFKNKGRDFRNYGKKKQTRKK